MKPSRRKPAACLAEAPKVRRREGGKAGKSIGERLRTAGERDGRCQYRRGAGANRDDRHSRRSRQFAPGTCPRRATTGGLMKGSMSRPNREQFTGRLKMAAERGYTCLRPFHFERRVSS